MKQLRILLLALPLLFIACEDEELVNALFYDGENFSGPNLPAGTHELAVRFTEDELSEHIGKQLVEASFFVGSRPSVLQIVVYGEGTPITPGAELYVANINSVITGERNNHEIVNPIDITGEDIWISVRVTHNQTQQSIGCDAGPAQANGDWLFRSDDPEWLPFSVRTAESVNWNIRGFVE